MVLLAGSLVDGGDNADDSTFTAFAVLDQRALALAAVAWLTVTAFVLRGLRAHPHDAFGAANAVTTLRAAIAIGIVALIPLGGEPGVALPAPMTGGLLWLLSATSAFALVLDAVDGALARAAGLVSPFGARFDVEVDSLSGLVLCLLIWRTGEVGSWVIAIGTLRYLFVGWSLIQPALRKPPAPSRRRKAIGALSTAALCAIVTPVVDPPVSTALAVVALAALLSSFGSDVFALLGSPDST